MAFPALNLPSQSAVFTACASISAFMMLFQTMLNNLLPRWMQNYIKALITRYVMSPSHNAGIIIEKWDGATNQIFEDAEIYLCEKTRFNIERLKVSKHPGDTDVSVMFDRSEIIDDLFDGVHIKWEFVREEGNSDSRNHFEDGKEFFELSFDKAHKQKILDHYIPFFMKRAAAITDEKQQIKLHSISANSMTWYSVILNHPSTFATLAMDPWLKKTVIDDLDRFVRRKEYYKKVGKAWKRGYLLYGPPGTGKSSLIAAMANYLKFDVYDLELANIDRDSDLRRVLRRTENRSILVIEDIDCSVISPDRNRQSNEHVAGGRQQLTLSGLLNFIDGLWSSCGDQRIIVFTTNNKEKLDPALLRPGRMDVHIHMSYLTAASFRVLAENYIDFTSVDDRLDLSEIEELIERVNVTPAEVAGELMKSEDPGMALEGLTNFLNGKAKEKEDSKEEKDKMTLVCVHGC